MYQLATTFTLLFAASAASAFKYAKTSSAVTRYTRLHALSTKPSFDPESYPGITAPLGYFDPLGLAPEDEQSFKRYRESELKHGRLAMLAVLAFYFQESGLNFGSSAIVGPAIFQYQQAEYFLPAFTPNVLGLCTAVECFNIVIGWQKPSDTLSTASGIASLKEDYINGDLKFDPLEFKPTSAKAFRRIQTAELNNGRLAMVALVLMIIEELLFKKSVF